MTYANIPRAPHLCLSNLGADWQKTRIIRTHVFVSVETFALAKLAPLVNQLQWGHAFVSVETRVMCAVGMLRGCASMGPRFCKRGN